MNIRSYDIDGVLYLDKGPMLGIKPFNLNDVIITGRSFQEAEETYNFLHFHGIFNPVFFNPLPFDAKGQRSSGIHKGRTILDLKEAGVNVIMHYEDDEIQIEEITKLCPWVDIIHLRHNLVDKMNVRRNTGMME